MNNLTPKEERRTNAVAIQQKIEVAQDNLDNLFEMITNQGTHQKYWHLVTLLKEINDLAEKLEDLSDN